MRTEFLWRKILESVHLEESKGDGR